MMPVKHVWRELHSNSKGAVVIHFVQHIRLHDGEGVSFIPQDFKLAIGVNARYIMSSSKHTPNSKYSLHYPECLHSPF